MDLHASKVNHALAVGHSGDEGQKGDEVHRNGAGVEEGHHNLVLDGPLQEVSATVAELMVVVCTWYVPHKLMLLRSVIVRDQHVDTVVGLRDVRGCFERPHQSHPMEAPKKIPEELP